MKTAEQIVIDTLRQLGEVTLGELVNDIDQQRRLTGLQWPLAVPPAEVVRQLIRERVILEREAGRLFVPPEKVIQVTDVQRRMF